MNTDHPKSVNEDKDVPAQAVEAMRQAFDRARVAGHTLVLVDRGRVQRVSPDGRVSVLKDAPPRIEVEQAVVHLHEGDHD